MASPSKCCCQNDDTNYEDVSGDDFIAIPRNGNGSNGMMFAMQDDFAEGAPLDASYAEERQKWERLCESVQITGDGETLGCKRFSVCARERNLQYL